MAKYSIEDTTLTGIADAIREKEGTTEAIPVADMASRITAIEAGGGLNIAYGTTPPDDTSKLWVPLTQEPDNVEISGDSLQNAVDAIQTKVTTLLTGLEGAASVAIDGKIYIFGGDNGETSGTSTIQKYDPTTDELTTLPVTLGNKIYYASAVAIGGKAYVFGGRYDSSYNTTSYFSTIQEFDPETNTVVTKEAKLSEKSCSHAAVAINGKAYIFGGTNGVSYNANYFDTIQEYDPTTDTIVTKTATLSVATCYMSAVAINNRACILGGRNSASNTIQEYDPSTDTIVTKSSTLSADAFVGTSAVAINNKAYIFGGSSSAIIQEYDPINDAVTTMGAVLGAETRYTTASEVDGIAYIFGGESALNTIQEYTPKAYLGANYLKVFASVYKTNTEQVVTNIVNSEKAQMKLYMTSAFLGDEDGYAKAQDAYVYDTVNSEWQALDGTSMTTDMLNALAELGVT